MLLSSKGTHLLGSKSFFPVQGSLLTIDQASTVQGGPRKKQSLAKDQDFSFNKITSWEASSP